MNIRNIAVIAHVDHGKTTLVDALLRASGELRHSQRGIDRALDSNDLERERGITILSKCTSLDWCGTRINIVDTPGHADFGGEVERILSMVDGVLLLVDAVEGPMAQTKFVVTKALDLGLRPILVVSKVDKPGQRAWQVQNDVFDLFDALNASEEQLDFPTLFTSARQAWTSREPVDSGEGMAPMFETLCAHIPPPDVACSGPFTMLVSLLETDAFLGRLVTGRIHSGVVRPNEQVKVLSSNGEQIEQSRTTKVLAFRGLERTSLDEAYAGDIVSLAGLSVATVADTVMGLDGVDALPAPPIDPSTIAVTISINTSPLAGLDGSKVTSRVLRRRLLDEANGNVAIEVRECDDGKGYEVAGRGELQLAILIEQMRREGYEMSVSRPRILFREDPETGKIREPVEEVVIDIDNDYTGVVVEALAKRRGELVSMQPMDGGMQRLVFHCPSRGLVGYHGDFLAQTRGTGVMNRLFRGYQPWCGSIPSRRNGVLVSRERGRSASYALSGLQDRGRLMIGPGEEVYPGMIIGEHSRENDLDVNPFKTKQLTNFRAAGKDDAIDLTPPMRLTLERAISFIDDDELVEITPHAIRLRKLYLDINERNRRARALSRA